MAEDSWKTPLKRGLGTATCDAVYAPPERKIDLFAADRFDIYCVGLIGLRVLVPSLSAQSSMEQFIEKVVRKNGHDIPRVCAAVRSGFGDVHSILQNEITVLTNPENRDIFDVLKSMIREKPKDRQGVLECLQDSFFDVMHAKVAGLTV